MAFLRNFVGFYLVYVVTSNVLKFRPADIQNYYDFLMKPAVPSRHMDIKKYQQYGLNVPKPLKAFHYDNCGPTGDSMVVVNGLTVSPDPVSLPGTVTIGFSVLFKNTVNSPVSTDVQIKKSVFGTYVTIPCIENFGSCHYDDFCTILSGVTCPEEFQSHNIPCSCPFTMGNYTLMPGISFTVDVPFLPSGDYYASANMTSNQQHVGCVELYASFA